MPFDEYLSHQQKNLDRVTQLRAFRAVVKPIDLVYERSLALSASLSGPYETVLLVCYKAFLSAAALIGRAQPEDAIAITRRAIEAACLGRAVRHNPENLRHWVAYRERAERQETRLRAAMTLGQPRSPRKRFPKPPPIVDPPDHGVVEYLRLMEGMLSEHAVHFTPQLLANQLRVKEHDKEGVTVEIGWFERSDRVIEIELIGLAVAHFKILDLLNECFDGALGRDEAWTFGRLAIQAIAQKFGSDLGFDRHAEEFERRVNADQELRPEAGLAAAEEGGG